MSNLSAIGMLSGLKQYEDKVNSQAVNQDSNSWFDFKKILTNRFSNQVQPELEPDKEQKMDIKT